MATRKTPSFRISLTALEIGFVTDLLMKHEPRSSATAKFIMADNDINQGNRIPNNMTSEDVKIHGIATSNKDMPTDEELKEIEAEFMAKLKKEFPIKDVKISDL